MNWFVVSVDVVGIPRVVHGPVSRDVCLTEAELYWAAEACAGEVVYPVCAGHPLLKRAQVQEQN